jgi:predicted transposase YbfD/YdcC
VSTKKVADTSGDDTAVRSRGELRTLTLNRAVRQHWGIENKLHWALDVSFGEDLDRKRQQNAAQNFSLLNRIALNLLKQDKTTKLGIKGKRLKAGWDNDYLIQLLGN